MSQFSLHRMRDGPELVCRIQTDLGTDTAYLLCAPVVWRKAWGPPVPALHIPLAVDGEDCLILMTQLIALPAGTLGPVVGTAAAAREAIVRAVDLLVVGF